MAKELLELLITARGWGYIVIMLIEGKVIDPLHDVSAVYRVTNVLSHFVTLRYIIPGSLYRGACHGLLFPETEPVI
ncbi:kinase-like protein [Penicillium coprophilum]|uniref:kinase-like protein n=1 Tax=Penicillium coprophilum TaxID=36646 RepID=UPI0023A49B50|nr:kinase-like protein [Penicillium coprophilum]KAJ5178393.1 kinase-like protein [Penicillium coprophilum]